MSLSVLDISHRYPTSSADLPPVLHNVSFNLAASEQLLLRGISGSGKTTLFNILAGLLTPSSGTVTLADQSIYLLSEAKRDTFRRNQIGYVFQTHHLLPILNAWENVAMPLAFNGLSTSVRKERAVALLAEIGLADFATHRPYQLSNGQRQRVAIARALINQPHMILADEPTASLDAESGESVIDLLQQSCQNNQTILLVASHDPLLSQRFARVVELQYGHWIESNKVESNRVESNKVESTAQGVAHA